MAKGTKTGGRKAGTPNKDKAELLQQIRDHIGDQEYHPVFAMAEIAVDEEMGNDMRFSAHREVAQYVAPKLKSVEHTADGDGFGLNLFMQLGPKPNGKGKNGGSS